MNRTNSTAWTAAKVRASSIAELVATAWSLMTNTRSCGGASLHARPIAQRRLRAAGVRYYLGGYNATEDQQATNRWGLLRPGEQPPPDLDWVETGVSLRHCAHKLGNGDACRGWYVYWH